MRFKNTFKNQELDISKLNSGYYIIKISDDEEVNNKKLIVR